MDVTRFVLIELYRRFRGTCCLHHLGERSAPKFTLQGYEKRSSDYPWQPKFVYEYVGINWPCSQEPRLTTLHHILIREVQLLWNIRTQVPDCYVWRPRRQQCLKDICGTDEWILVKSLDFAGFNVGLNDVLSQFRRTASKYLLLLLVPGKSSATRQ
jgi:hypothetical protein